MLSVDCFVNALKRLDEELNSVVGFDFPKIKISVLKVLLECVETDDPLALKGKYSNATLTWCETLRNDDFFRDFSKEEEKLVFQTYLKICKIK